MNSAINTNNPQWSAEELSFAILAIEAAAKQMNITPAEMHERLKAQNLIDTYLVKYYDVFHTMSLEHIAEDTIAALLKWEENTPKKGGEQ